MSCILKLLSVPFITIPSIVYGICAYVLVPFGWGLNVITGHGFNSSWAMRKMLVLRYIMMVFVVPVPFYFWWKPLAFIVSAIMILYLISRKYTGEAKREASMMQASEELDRFQGNLK